MRLEVDEDLLWGMAATTTNSKHLGSNGDDVSFNRPPVSADVFGQGP